MPWLLFLVCLLAGCVSTNLSRSPEAERSDFQLDTPISSQLSRHAETFSRYVAGLVSKEEFDVIRANCKDRPSENPFCYSYAHLETLDSRIRLANPIVRAKLPPPPTPVEIKKRGQTITNWKELRNANVKAILPTLAALPRKDLDSIAHKAQAEGYCPNNIAVAAGATLEDSLPEKGLAVKIARLYERGGRCAAKAPFDRENFYTRAGLLYVVAEKKSLATQALSRAARVQDASPSRALYWLCRIQEKKGKPYCEQLVRTYPFSFHALLAHHLLSRDPGDLLASKMVMTPIRRSRTSPQINPVIEQAEILRALRYDYAADLLVNWALEESPKRLEPELHLYLAQIGLPPSQLSLANNLISHGSKYMTTQTLNLYFPKGYFSLFEKHSDGNLDAYLLLSIARQESRFHAKAVSVANAQGLLQILPETSAKVGEGSADLFDAETNIRVGARYYRQLLSEMPDHSIALASAGYNAGPEKVQGWLKRFPTSDPILFMDLIPFRETRNYVAAILRNYFWYRKVYRNLPSSPRPEIPQILGQTDGRPPA